MENSTINQEAPKTEQYLNNQETFFLKYKKAIIAAVVAVIVIIAGSIAFIMSSSRRHSMAIRVQRDSSQLQTTMAAQMLLTSLTSMQVSAMLISASGRMQ